MDTLLVAPTPDFYHPVPISISWVTSGVFASISEFHTFGGFFRCRSWCTLGWNQITFVRKFPQILLWKGTAFFSMNTFTVAFKNFKSVTRSLLIMFWHHFVWREVYNGLLEDHYLDVRNKLLLQAPWDQVERYLLSHSHWGELIRH